MSAPNLGSVPRRAKVVDKEGYVTEQWDIFQNGLLSTLQAFANSILSGPDANPNGIVIGRPGYLYRAMGEGITASALYQKTSGVDTNTGWVLV